MRRSRAATALSYAITTSLALTGLNVLFVAVGYEVFALLPPFAKNYAGVSERWVGFIWLANTLLIVLIQLPVSKALEGRRRMAALALMNLLWATAALLVLAGGELLNGTSAALVFMTATMVFALGETLQGPTQAPLVADLAPDHLRGRYFALGSMSWSAGSILGPAVGGPLLGCTHSRCGRSRPPSAWARRWGAWRSSGGCRPACAAPRSRSPSP